MNDDQFFLANAYLDGELDAAEHTIAEADPAVMAGVEQLRALQAQVRDVEPPTSAARETAIGGALRAFDSQRSLSIDSGPRVPERIVPLRPRPSYGRWLGVAAAVVAIGFVGVVITRAGGGDDEAAIDGAFSDEAPSAARTGADEVLEGNAVASASGEATAEESAAAEFDAAEAAPVTEAPAVASDSEATGEAAGDASAPAATQLATTATVAAYDPAQPIVDAAGLAAAGAYYLDLETRNELPPTPNTSCDVSRSGVTFRVPAIAEYVLPDGIVPVLIAVDDATGETLAVDPDNCSIIASSLGP